MEGIVTSDGQGRAGLLVSHGLVCAFWVLPPHSEEWGEWEC